LSSNDKPLSWTINNKSIISNLKSFQVRDFIKTYEECVAEYERIKEILVPDIKKTIATFKQEVLSKKTLQHIIERLSYVKIPIY